MRSAGTDERVSRRMWFAILGAPTAWAAQGTLGWLFAEGACFDRARALGSLSGSAVRAVELTVSGAALLVAIASLIAAISLWRASSNEGLDSIHAFARGDFLAAVALFVSASFTLGIFWGGAGALMLPLCERMR